MKKVPVESPASGKNQRYNYILPFAESFMALASDFTESFAAFIEESMALLVESMASIFASFEESIALTVESLAASVEVPLLHAAKAPIAKTTKSFFIVVMFVCDLSLIPEEETGNQVFFKIQKKLAPAAKPIAKQTPFRKHALLVSTMIRSFKFASANATCYRGHCWYRPLHGSYPASSWLYPAMAG